MVYIVYTEIQLQLPISFFESVFGKLERFLNVPVGVLLIVQLNCVQNLKEQSKMNLK